MADTITQTQKGDLAEMSEIGTVEKKILQILNFSLCANVCEFH